MYVFYLIAMLGAIVPMMFFGWIASLFARAVTEKKRWGLVLLVFLWGAIPSIATAMVANRLFNQWMMYDPELGLSTPHQTSAAVIILGLLQPLWEESVKALPLLLIFVLVRKQFAGARDGLIYAAAVGLGFSMVENYQYILGAGLKSGVAVAIAVIVMRSIVFGLMHTLWISPFGIGLGIARNSESRMIAVLAPCCGLVLSVLLHGLHNASFLWVTLERGYGVVAVVSSLTIYGLGVVAWIVVAFKSAKRGSLPGHASLRDSNMV